MRQVKVQLFRKWCCLWATVCKKVRPILSVRCLSCCLSCPVCNVGVLWPNGWTDQDETWHAGRLGPVHIVLDGDAGPLPQRGNPPIFSPYLFWLNGSMDQDATWCWDRPQALDPRDIVRWGPSPSPKRDRVPNFQSMSFVAKRLHGSRCHLVWS